MLPVKRGCLCPSVVPRLVRRSVNPTVIPLRPRKSFLEQLVMWAVDLIAQQWHHMDKKL